MKKLLLSLFLSLFALSASALSPLQLGVAGESLQLVSPDTPVVGLRLNLPFSENQTAAGLDLGLFSLSDTFTGIRLNAFSWAEAPSGGVTLALFDSCTDYTGAQLAFFGTASGTFTGLQMGAFPYADTVRGAQVGLVNRARELHGLQLGLLNILTDSPHNWLPILRVSFCPPQLICRLQECIFFGSFLPFFAPFVLHGPA